MCVATADTEGTAGSKRLSGSLMIARLWSDKSDGVFVFDLDVLLLETAAAVEEKELGIVAELAVAVVEVDGMAELRVPISASRAASAEFMSMASELFFFDDITLERKCNA